ncbi:MAG TPA: hypothetical protein VFT01_05470, partial [Homoserinimonas sp.]|nr:hypothetical protein [Homoserinimonas sp.]
ASQRSPQQRSSGRPVGATAVVHRSHWMVPVLRAIPAIAVGVIITFTEDHGPRIGLIAFGVFALVSGAILLVGSLRTVTDPVVRGVFIAQGAISLIGGAASVLLWESGIGVLLLIVTVFAALTGVLELYAGLRSRGTAPSRDWLTVGAYTAVAAIVFVLIPPDSILVIGLIGAYAIILGVFLLIAGLSLKWGSHQPEERDPAQGKVSP